MNFIMDARTGLGRFHDFRISNYQLMMELIDYCLDHPIEDVLALPDVKERVDLYFEQQEKFWQQLKEVSRQEGRCVVVDLRDLDVIYTGNRFLIYTMYPDAYFSIHIAWGFRKQNTAIMIGKSIFKDSPDVDKNIADICLKYGGGGHKNAGTCQVDNGDAASACVSGFLLRKKRLELSRPCDHRHLKPARLPIPPLPLTRELPVSF